MATGAARSAKIPAGLDRDQLLEMYYYLRLTRSLESGWWYSRPAR